MPLDSRFSTRRTATPIAPVAQPGTISSTLSWVGDKLRRPGGAVAGFTRGLLGQGDAISMAIKNLTGDREDDFDDVLADQGFGDTWARRAAGFAGDVVLDPLNVVPLGGAVKMLGRGAKFGLTKADDAIRGLGLTGLSNTAHRVKDAFGDAVIPYYSLRKVPEYRDARRLRDSAEHTVMNREYDRAWDTFEKLDVPTRQTLLKQLDAGTLADTIKDDAVARALRLERENYTAIGKEGADLGVLDPKAVKRHEDTYAARVFLNENSIFNKAARKREIVPTSPFAKQRQERTLLEAIEAGAEPDAAIVSFIRGVDAARSSENARFLRDIAEKYGKEMPNGPQQGWWRLESTLPLTKFQIQKFGNLHVPQVIGEDLKKMFASGGQDHELLRIMENMMGMWRRGATVLRPGFHMTNLVGNVYNAAIGGLKNPLRYVQGLSKLPSEELAAKLAARNPTLLKAAEQAGLTPKDYISDMLRKHGMTPVGLGDAFGAGELVNTHTPMGVAEELRKRLPGAPQETLTAGQRLWRTVKWPFAKYSEKMGDLGNLIEGGSKRALFYDELAKGMDPGQAVLNVKDKLFDYSELTPFERKYFRTIFPFYTWMRKNTPLQVRSLYERPSVPAFYAKGQDALEDMGEERGTTTPFGQRPLWYQDRGYLPLPGANSTEGGQSYINPYLPIADFNKIPGMGGMSNFQSAAKDIVGGLSPMIKAPLELALNRSFFTGLPLYDEKLGITGDLQPASSVLQIPLLKEATAVAAPKYLGMPAGIDPKDGRLQVPAYASYTLDQALPIISSLGRAGLAMTDPAVASSPMNAWKFMGVPLEERTALQQIKDRQAALQNARKLRAALAGQARIARPTSLDEAGFNDRYDAILAALDALDQQ